MENSTVEQVAPVEIKYINIKVALNGREYIYLIPDNSPIGESYDACYQVLSKLMEFIKESGEKMVRIVDVAPSPEPSVEVDPQVAEEPKE